MPIPEQRRVVPDPHSPILSPLPDADLPKPITQIDLDKANDQVSIDLKKTPLKSILSYVEGSRWEIDYFSQILNTDSALTGQSISTSGTYQQYNLIKGLVLKVTSPLSYNQEDENKSENYSGTALVVSRLVPNENDMFAADIGVGYPAIFRVTESKKNSVHRQTTYEISYVLDTADPKYAKDLIEKTIQVYTYRQDFELSGQDPFVVTKENEALLSVQASYDRLRDYYINRFYQDEHTTFCLPAQQLGVYDPFLVEFVLQHFAQDDISLLQSCRKLNVGKDVVFKQTSIWDALTHRDMGKIVTGFSRYKLVSSDSFKSIISFDNIAYSGIPYCIYPADPLSASSGLDNTTTLGAASLSLNTQDPVSFFSSLTTGQAENVVAVKSNELASTIGASDGTVPLTQVATDDHYVMPASFYNSIKTKDASTATVFDRLVISFINKQSQDHAQLIECEKLAYQWGALEQFYYIPVLLVILKNHSYDFKATP